MCKALGSHTVVLPSWHSGHWRKMHISVTGESRRGSLSTVHTCAHAEMHTHTRTDMHTHRYHTHALMHTHRCTRTRMHHPQTESCSSICAAVCDSGFHKPPGNQKPPESSTPGPGRVLCMVPRGSEAQGAGRLTQGRGGRGATSRRELGHQLTSHSSRGGRCSVLRGCCIR